MERKIITTSDGSHSIFIPELNEHYHSFHGAIRESKHVFIEAGLKYVAAQQQTIHILEIGLGTGLNALLTFMEAQTLSKSVHYTALEAFPLSVEITGKLNYIEALHAEEYAALFDLIHGSEWEKETAITTACTLKKLKNTLQEVLLPDDHFDLIYFDAFGPPVQPEMWTEEVFAKIYKATKNKGVLVTYCAKGEVKRTLKKVGFTIQNLPGPPGKREMIRAVKI